MKKVIAILAVVSLFVIGAVVFAHGPGGWGDGHMMGPGYGRHMMDVDDFGDSQEFLNKTAELRKELHDKKFQYFEALRNPKTTVETLTKLKKEIRELREKITEKAPGRTYGRAGGYEHCW